MAKTTTITTEVALNVELLNKKLRQFGLTRSELADLLQVSGPAMRTWMRGDVPRAESLARMALYLSQREPGISVFDPSCPELSLVVVKGGEVPTAPAPAFAA